MQEQAAGPIAEFVERFSSYLPALAAGLVVLAVGVAIGWIVKRAVVRILIWLRLDRLGGRVGWRAAFGKGDVRAALYNLTGGIAMVLVVLIFLENALDIMRLEVLSRMIDRLVFYLPNLGLVALIVLIGVVLANLLSVRATEALEEEEFAHARLTGRALKGVLLFIVGALALWQLGFARQIVLSAFLISFGAIGVAFAMALGLGGARAVQRALEALFEKRREG
jgi:Mechanosensitive ion channel, conserved TM helix